LGSRSSEKFGRIYDKGAESSLDVMQGCVRYELELKGDTAFAQIKQLATSRVVQDAIAGKVQKFIRDRLGVSSFARVNVETLVCPPRACDQLRSLEWIQVSVSPTIKRLIESGHAVALFDCLHVEKLLQALRDRDTLNTLDRKLSEVA
jgi:DNA relaxase NicK